MRAPVRRIARRPAADPVADSLYATFLRNRIVATLRGSSAPEAQHASLRVTQNFIFEHPTLQGLAETLAVMISQEP